MKKSKIQFRSHHETDLPLRVKWFSDPQVSVFLGGNEKYVTSVAKEKSWFAKYKQDDCKRFYTILYDSLPVGLVGLLEIFIGESASVFIAVGEPGYWGKGIGFEAINFIEKIAKKLGIKKLTLGVSDQNTRAINLYKKTGFVVIDEIDHEIQMEKVL